MARGFESKDVEFQQAEAERGKGQGRQELTSEERAAKTKRHTIELSLARMKADLGSARSAAHRAMLTQAIESLEEQLQRMK
jgi:hypothetical protein